MWVDCQMALWALWSSQGEEVVRFDGRHYVMFGWCFGHNSCLLGVAALLKGLCWCYPILTLPCTCLKGSLLLLAHGIHQKQLKIRTHVTLHI